MRTIAAMPVQLDHTIVPSRSQVKSAQLLGELLGVEWAATALGPFSPVFVNEGLTLDFQDTTEAFPIYHFAFRVSDEEFDAILGRLKERGIAWRSTVFGPVDHQVDTRLGGRIAYWNVPDGHMWEILTVSYARSQPPAPKGTA